MFASISAHLFSPVSRRRFTRNDAARNEERRRRRGLSSRESACHIGLSRVKRGSTRRRKTFNFAGRDEANLGGVFNDDDDDDDDDDGTFGGGVRGKDETRFSKASSSSSSSVSSSSSSSSSSSQRIQNARGFVGPKNGYRERYSSMYDDTDDDDDDDEYDDARAEENGYERRGRKRRSSSFSFSSPKNRNNRRNRNKREPGNAPLPNVTLLTNGEVEKCLPIAATSNQYGYFWGTTATAMQRVAISILGIVLCSTINDFEIGTALQVPFATFFLWAPIALAARRNSAARAGEFVGLWRPEVKNVEIVPVFPKTFERNRRKSRNRRAMSEMLVIDFIDPISSFEVSFRIPNERRYDDVQIGDACELLVSSDDDLFRDFVAIREAYIPELDVFIGDYPFLDRTGFVLVSKRV